MTLLLKSLRRDWMSWTSYERLSAAGIMGTLSATALLALHHAV